MDDKSQQTQHRGDSGQPWSSELPQAAAICQVVMSSLLYGKWREASQHLLRLGLNWTGSEYGFIGVVVDHGILRVLAHEGVVWDRSINRSFYEEALRTYNERGYIEFTNLNNLFGRVITTGKIVLSNNVKDDTRASGNLPPGHPPLNRFLGVPSCYEGNVVGMIAVANRKEGYTAVQQRQLEQLAHVVSPLYAIYRQNLLEQKQSQELKAANAKLQEIERLRSAFLTMVAHELRTPVAAIRGLVDNMVQGVTGPLSTQQDEYCGRIQNKLNRLTRMADQLIFWSRVERERENLTYQSLQLGKLLKEVVEDFRYLAVKKDIIVEFVIPTEDPVIQGDWHTLEQIFGNLLSNAIKFTPANGRISLAITQSQGGECSVQIRDTGVGIAPEHLPHLFGEFSKIPSSLPTEQGPQLGLFLVKSLLSQHQASIAVESELGSGSTFTITFPAVIAKR